ncbi:MAG: AAA family ATPase, partial [Eggerthellaceae bacterium]|nr:AAA family ATPase [Eggerthellaceae bacterium]
MKRLAVYGKGGIGKSTISANLSAALVGRGRTVLQVGCDPKHDSTKLLLGGRPLTCVLDYLRDTLPGEYDLGAVMQTGYAGVGCVEAGGPKPGVGCAGRGIISTFEMLEQFHLDQRYDTILYDVLGDVVCGGFAVPIRREYADTILIVTSGEFMALYAANNILRGVRTYDGETGKRIAGLVCNCRNVSDEVERVERFAAAVGLPVFATVPRSNSFAEAEGANMTVMEQGRDAQLIALFEDMAARLVDGAPLFSANPLSDEELEEVVLRDGSAVARDPEDDAGRLPAPPADAPDIEMTTEAEYWAQPDLTDPTRY